MGDHLRRAKAAGITWPLPQGLDDAGLRNALSRRRRPAGSEPATAGLGQGPGRAPAAPRRPSCCLRLESHEVVVNLIARTTTHTGLAVHAESAGPYSRPVGQPFSAGKSSDVGTVVLGATVVSGTAERGRRVVTVVPGGSSTMVAGGGGATVAVGVGAGGGSCGDSTDAIIASEGAGELGVTVVGGVVAAGAAADGDATVAWGTSPSIVRDGGEVASVAGVTGVAGVAGVVLGARGTVDAGTIDVDWRPAASIC